MKPAPRTEPGGRFPATALLAFLLLPFFGCTERNEEIPGTADTGHLPAASDSSNSPGGATTGGETPAGAAKENRPAAKTDTILLEGMPEPIELRLVDEGLPFSTYFPDKEMKMEQSSSGEGTGVRFIANFGGTLNPDAYMHIFVPENMSTVEEMEKLVAGTGGVIESNGWKGEKAVSMSSYCPWGKSSYSFQGKKGEGFIVGHACIGMHGGKPFYVLVAYPEDYAEGFGPRAAMILSELRWDDTGEGLE